MNLLKVNTDINEKLIGVLFPLHSIQKKYFKALGGLGGWSVKPTTFQIIPLSYEPTPEMAILNSLSFHLLKKRFPLTPGITHSLLKVHSEVDLLSWSKNNLFSMFWFCRDLFCWPENVILKKMSLIPPKNVSKQSLNQDNLEWCSIESGLGGQIHGPYCF